MHFNDFTKRFKLMVSAMRFAPVGDEHAEMWFGMVSNAKMTDDQINLAFKKCIESMNEFPSWKQFKDAGINNSTLDANLEATKIFGKLKAAFHDPNSIPESSAPMGIAVGPELYEKLGGHWFWYDIANGRRMDERLIKDIILAHVKEKAAEELTKQIEGGSNATRLPPTH